MAYLLVLKQSIRKKGIFEITNLCNILKLLCAMEECNTYHAKNSLVIIGPLEVAYNRFHFFF